VTIADTTPADRFTSERDFQVWAYTVGHGQLLLRSTKSEAVATRVDVVFKNVRHVDLPTSMTGLHIEKAGERRYLLGGADWSGEVDAGVMVVAEDDGSYEDPSRIYLGGVGPA
jgi:hypothetical protein